MGQVRQAECMCGKAHRAGGRARCTVNVRVCTHGRSGPGLSGRVALGSDGLSAGCRCGEEQLHAAGCPGCAAVRSCDQACAMVCRAAWPCLAAGLVAFALEVCDQSLLDFTCVCPRIVDSECMSVCTRDVVTVASSHIV